VAIKLNIPHGGAIPKGRMTEEGVLSAKYNAEELKTKFYPKRTEKNVVYSDGTVVCLKVFLADNDIEVLNVAGSRASKDSMIYEKPMLLSKQH